MKKTKTILCIALAVCLVLLLVWCAHVPALKKGVQSRSQFRTSTMYVVSVLPNTDEAGYDTQTVYGIDQYWRTNHARGRGIEAVLQQTKDGELVVLSGDLSGSNAASLYGDGVTIADLTLKETQSINLLYNVTDEEGFRIYSTISERSLPAVSVLSLKEYLTVFNDAEKSNAVHILKFADEKALQDLNKAIDKVYKALKDTDMLDYAVLCLQNKRGASYADNTYTDLLRAATASERRGLFCSSLIGIRRTKTPYVLVYADANSKYASAKFIHYAKNSGLAVILLDDADAPQAKDVERLYKIGADAVATHQPEAVIQYLKDAKQAAKGSDTTADSTAEQ